MDPGYDSTADAARSRLALQRWGSLASFLMALAFIIAPLIYLTGNLRTALGPASYSLADFLYGPLWGASLVTAVFALRQRIGESAQHRMSLALLVSAIAAAAFVTVACIRAANRHYHLIHPELRLETSTTVLIVWATLVAGVSAAAWHFLGWVFILVASAGWTSRRLPTLLSALYLVGGVASLFVYQGGDELEGFARLIGLLTSIWLGVLLWKAKPAVAPASGTDGAPLARS
jgi:predicted neutral ceramidase superfamily lipid hydrolase